MALVASSRSHRSLLLLLRHHLRLLSSSPSPPPTAPSAAPLFSGRHAFDPAIRRLARARRFSDIEALLEPLKKDPRASDEPFLAAVITSYAAAGMLDRALRTLDEIPSLGAPRTALSLNALLSALNHSPLVASRSRVPDLFADLTRRLPIAPNKVSYGILVKSYCLAGDTKKALAVLKEMQEKKIEVTTVTYTTLLDSFYKEGRPEEAEGLWKEMQKKGCKPDLPAYNVRVMHRALDGKPQDVLDLIKEIEAAGLKPDTITYNYLMSCYCSHGRFEEAKNVYKGLEEKGCAPNTATFKNFLASLCKIEDFDGGLEVFMDSVKLHKVPDLWSVKLLVEGLMKKSKVRAAKRVVSGLKKKFPEDFTGDWKKLEKVVGVAVDGEGSEQAEAA
ncbi:pentatricopeptide repeat-containing protein At4g36680, mitochondrial-like [Phoenix dactylifera]|uniref:Pentatricopeptide repeat-containing protein At4g36680, mitochondrial-like n=1 Tax=Phoenix dactylifera TaxID=42345 RepID=A0A8B8ZHU3_PHODC|nr:pentatricopeptide repeat-containing protein At4g36680, mitochondrial-like [Phoenix dactylifera]